MSREAQFNFIPVIQLESIQKQKEKLQEYVSLNTKHGTITFSKEYAQRKGLDGTILLFFADTEKKALGWRKFSEDSLPGMSGARKLNKSVVQSTGSVIYQMSIKKIVNNFNFKKEYNFKRMPIETYTRSVLDGQVDYVVLKEQDYEK
jgi:hypothetical protein